MNVLVLCFEKLAKNNSLILLFQLSVMNQQCFHQLIVETQKCFLDLMNTDASVNFKKKKIQTFKTHITAVLLV